MAVRRLKKYEASQVQAEVRPHPAYPETHNVGIITTERGYCYSCTWAGPLTPETVLEAWKTDRKAFEPYRS